MAAADVGLFIHSVFLCTFEEEEEERIAVHSHSLSQSFRQVILSAVGTESTPKHQHHFPSS